MRRELATITATAMLLTATPAGRLRHTIPITLEQHVISYGWQLQSNNLRIRDHRTVYHLVSQTVIGRLKETTSQFALSAFPEGTPYTEAAPSYRLTAADGLRGVEYGTHDGTPVSVTFLERSQTAAPWRVQASLTLDPYETRQYEEDVQSIMAAYARLAAE